MIEVLFKVIIMGVWPLSLAWLGFRIFIDLVFGQKEA